jgi:hypothetical protein
MDKLGLSLIVYSLIVLFCILWKIAHAEPQMVNPSQTGVTSFLELAELQRYQ